MDWIDELHTSEGHIDEALSFQEYIEVYQKNPVRETRTVALYLKDLFDHYGKAENGGYHFFQTDHADAPPVFGQFETQEAIYQNLINFCEEGHNNKFLLLVGPNGSSKSSLVKKLMVGCEDYSKTDEGVLFTFSWIFPIDSYVKGQVGLGAIGKKMTPQSYAHLEDKEISAILTSELKDHPLLLVPEKTRKKLIEEGLKDSPKILESVKKSYLFNGDVSKKNRLIYDALLKNYKGDHLEVLKHIRVERFTINKRHSVGAATIEPQLHVDARLQQITMDKRLGSLPPSLQSLNLFNLNGEVVFANRGILEFSDLLKRPLDAFKYLLSTMESKTVNLQGILTELDIFFIGSSNEVHLSAFKQHPDFNSFRARFNFLRVPYLLNYKEELKIYKEQISKLGEMTFFEPHSLEFLCLWSVMTRLRSSDAKHFEDPKLGKIAASLNPIEKALFLADETIPERLDSESAQTLLMSRTLLEKEYDNDGLYQGKFGISPREVKQMIYELASQYSDITFLEISEYLTDLAEQKQNFDFLNIVPQGDFHSVKKFNEYLQAYCLDRFDNELRDALGLVDDRSYDEYLERYIIHVSALLKGEKIKNVVTAKFEPSDEYFIKEFEQSIGLQENPESFRSYVISRLAAYSLDNPGKSIDYLEVFPDLVKQLKESFREEQKTAIQKIAQDLVFYIEDQPGLGAEDRASIDKILQTLEQNYQYKRKGAISLLKYLIESRY